MNTVPLSADYLARVLQYLPDTQCAILLRLATYVASNQCLLPLDADACAGIARASTRVELDALTTVLADHFVITELGRAPSALLFRKPGGLHLSNNATVTLPVTSLSRERDASSVTPRVTHKERQQRYRDRIDELRDQLAAKGISTRKNVSQRELVQLMEEHESVTQPVTLASRERDAPSRARPEFPEYQYQRQGERALSGVTLGGGDGAATAYGSAALAMKAAGMAALNPSHPQFRALVDAGAQQELVDATREFPGKPFAYVLTTVENRRREAATRAAVPAKQGRTFEDLVGPTVMAMMRGES